MTTDIIVLILAILTIIGLVILRGRSAGKYDVKLTDAAVAAILICLWMLVSGRISSFVVGSEGVTVQTAILDASTASISSQVLPLSIGPVDKAGRGGDEAISHVLANHAEALEFTLGTNVYNAAAIKKELTILTQYVFFKYVIITHIDGTLFGILDAHKLVRILGRRPGPYSWQDFTQFINSGDAPGKEALKGIPSFIHGKLAAKQSDDKSIVLDKMQAARLEILPVVAENGRFIGVISRSELTAGLLMEISKTLSE